MPKTQQDTFPRSFPVDGEVAKLLPITDLKDLLWESYGETGIMDFAFMQQQQQRTLARRFLTRKPS